METERVYLLDHTICWQTESSASYQEFWTHHHQRHIHKTHVALVLEEVVQLEEPLIDVL
jgi:hypothetical protein